MVEKKKPKRITRTQEPGYFFGAAKSADARRVRLGMKRTPAKLPTSLSDLRKLEKQR